MAANFENLFISPGFPLNFRKVTEFQRNTSKSPRVMDKNLLGVPKNLSGLNRVKGGKTEPHCRIHSCYSFPVENEQKRDFKVLIKIDMD